MIDFITTAAIAAILTFAGGFTLIAPFLVLRTAWIVDRMREDAEAKRT